MVPCVRTRVRVRVCVVEMEKDEPSGRDYFVFVPNHCKHDGSKDAKRHGLAEEVEAEVSKGTEWP